MAAVRRYDILDTPPDGAFDRITALAARLFRTPIAIVSIVDADRIWFKSRHGLDVTEIGRDPGLCASAILQDQPWLVRDAAVDPRTLANPLVAGQFGLRFYAGIPLATADGHNLGTLCVIDREPRDVSDEEVATLRDLAGVVMDEMELRLSARRALASEAKARHGAEEIARELQDTLLPHRLPRVPGLEVAARYNVAHRDQVGGDFYDLIPLDGGCAAVVGDVCGKGTTAASLTGTVRWALRAVLEEVRKPADALRAVNSVLLRADDDPSQGCTLAVAMVGDDGAEVTVALAGHPHPLVVRKSGDVERVGTTAPAVGWVDAPEFADDTAILEPGDLLVMFTDGLFEGVVGHGATDDRDLLGLFAGLAGRQATDVADALDDAVAGEVLRDDAAFLVLRRQEGQARLSL